MAYKQAPRSMALKALIGNQKNLPEALKAKILAAPETPAKQLGVDPVETAKFEAAKAVQMKFEDKIDKAGGIGEVDSKTGKSLNPKVRRLEKRSHRKQKRVMKKAGRKAAKKGYNMVDFSTGKIKHLSPKSVAKQTRQGTAKELMEPIPTKEKKMMAVKGKIKKQPVKPKKKVTMQADSGKFKSPEDMRLEEAQYKSKQRKTNAKAAKIERKTVRQDLRAQKQERRAANMKKRLDRKEKTKKTRVGKVLQSKK